MKIKFYANRGPPVIEDTNPQRCKIHLILNIAEIKMHTELLLNIFREAMEEASE